MGVTIEGAARELNDVFRVYGCEGPTAIEENP